MTRHHAQTAVAILLAALFVASCIPTFEHPLPEPDPLAADPGLLGTWLGRDADAGEESRLLVFTRPSGHVDLVFISGINDPDAEDGVDVSLFEGYTTLVGEERFLCIRARGMGEEKDDEEKPGVMIAAYAIDDGGGLAISLFGPNQVKALIESGKLQGAVEKGKHTQTIVVTSPAEALVELVKKGSSGVFYNPEHAIKFERE